MKSWIIKRSIVIAGHRTSVSIEEAFWQALKDIALSRKTALSELVASIDSGRRHGNLSSAIRLFVLDHLQTRIGHGGNGGAGVSGGTAPAEGHTRRTGAPAASRSPSLP
jgi:predicted DNA-binding ribbon-helix-helix protein